MSDAVMKTLEVVSCEEKARGSNDKGEWVLYDCVCKDEHGTPIDEKFKSFRALEVGKVVEYSVQRQESEKYGVSFLISLPRKGGAALGPKVDELRDRLDVLEPIVAKLEKQNKWLYEQLQRVTAGTSTPPQEPSNPGPESEPSPAPEPAGPERARI